MLGAITSRSFFSAAASSRPELQRPRYDHEHASEGCGFCQPKSEKTSAPAATISDNTHAQDKQTVEEKSAISSPSPTSSGDLTLEEKKEIEELKKRDQEVRLHEQAHLAAAGGHARGGPSFTYTYQKGPDGKMYAVGGEVPIDLSPVADNPQATIHKAEAIQRAALASANPSGPDQQVAAKAAAMATKARQELAQQSQEITSTGKKVSQKPQVPHSEEVSSTTASVQSRQEAPSSTFPTFSPYSQQKQRHSALPPGGLLSVYA